MSTIGLLLLLQKQDKWRGTHLLKYTGFCGTFLSVGLATSAVKSVRKALGERSWSTVDLHVHWEAISCATR